ncbi:hypothetical protein HOP50_12g65980 [Chloropicon primus]|uniref:Uncharacterized protein n=1 Tax=Chloropicon primus TaxID=1764295 RepID=A0A5B8MWV7_9CHLO|nr:hypothetical protein A3770_12p65800 [Chloropicon primus]UPR03270.1 hypothetical protein HOP50_12g65980 [Chloropicon primus]|eukprot:QDZ24062.1 hypothetical protein A3770_12p65800 [Chloropicon primus]
MMKHSSRKTSITENYNKYQQSKTDEKKKGRKRHESKNDSELRKLKKENARLQEELSMTQQTPREEVTCKDEIVDARKRVVQLRLNFNSIVSERKLKDKQLINLTDKVHTINMELGENEGKGSSAVNSPASSLKSLTKMTATVQEEHERLKGRLVQTNNSIMESECYELMLQYRKKQYMLTQNGMESQYLNLRQQLNILEKQHHEIELNVRTLEHGEITAVVKAEDIMRDIKKYEKQRVELKVQQKTKKDKQTRMQEYMHERERNRQNLKKEMSGDAYQASNQENSVAATESMDFIDALFEKFMDTLVERIGVGNNLAAVLHKLENMNDTQEEVQNRKVETEIRLQILEKEKAQLEQQLQEIAVNGTDFSFRRHEIDEIEEKTHKREKRLKYLLGQLDKTGKQIAGLQIGIDSILNKLDYLKVKAPADQQKVEVKADKSGVPGIQSMTGADAHKGEADKHNVEDHEDPLLRQLELVEQKLNRIVDALAVSHISKAAGDSQEGEAEGVQSMSWLSSDLQKLGMDMPQQGQYNLRVNLTTPTNALPSAPSSAGAFDAEALSDDSLELPENVPVKKKPIRQSASSKAAAAKRRNKSKSAIIPPSKPKPPRAKQGSMFAGRDR